jgi:signal transduction histidine kinase
MSETSRARLDNIFQRICDGTPVCEVWVFYPRGIPKTCRTRFSGVMLSDNQMAFLCEAQHMESVSADEMLRGAEAVKYVDALIALWKRNGTSLMRNPAATRLLGSVHHANQNNILLQDYFLDPAEATAIFDKMEKEGWASKEIQLKTQDAGVVWLALDVRLTQDPSTGEATILTHAKDLTERREVEIELIRAREEAEAATKAKGEFLAIISHEIRTPLNSICGMTTLLLDTEQTLSPDQRKSLSLIRTSGDALLGILEDVLDFSRIESGKLDLHIEQFDLRMCIEDVLDLFRSQIVQRNVFVSYFVDASVARRVLSDEKRLRQCMWNLIANSMKFTPMGGRISILVNKTDMVPDGLLFTIKDTGIGIAPQNQSVIFSHFAQADSGTSRKFGGSGLGLALVRRLTEIMGGKVWLEESIPDVGSTFCFCISAPEVEYLDNGGNSVMRGQSFSVVCDDLPTSNLISAICTSLDMTLKSNALDSNLAFVDDGKWEMIRTLKKHGVKVVIVEFLKGPNPAITNLSAKTWQARAVEKVEADAHVYVPFREATLQEVIASIFQPERRASVFDLNTMNALSISSSTTRPKSTFESLGMTHPLKILCVDDNHVNLLLIKKFLEKMMFKNVDSATDGNVAVEMASVLEHGRTKYDLILTDINSTFLFSERGVF